MLDIAFYKRQTTGAPCCDRIHAGEVETAAGAVHVRAGLRDGTSNNAAIASGTTFIEKAMARAHRIWQQAAQ